MFRPVLYSSIDKCNQSLEVPLFEVLSKFLGVPTRKMTRYLTKFTTKNIISSK